QDAPTATDDAYAVNEDTTLNVAAAGVLANDSDADGDSLSAILVSGPANGALVLNADGSFNYTPDPDFNGIDSFTYKANDGATDSNVATVTLTVTPVQDAPTAADDAYAVNEDATLNIAAAGVLANDGDVDGDPLSAVLVSGPASGALVLNADGSFTYTPNADFNGIDSFSYKAHDGTAAGNAATVTITVNPVQDAPTALNDAYAVVQDQSLNVAAAGVLANDGDADGDPLAAALVSGPANGAVVLNPDGSFTYTPAAGFSGGDTFAYLANDGTADSNVATVTLTISPLPPVPVTPVAEAADESFLASVPAPIAEPSSAQILPAADAPPEPVGPFIVSSSSDGPRAIAETSEQEVPLASATATDSAGATRMRVQIIQLAGNDAVAAEQDQNVAPPFVGIGPASDAEVPLQDAPDIRGAVPADAPAKAAPPAASDRTSTNEALVQLAQQQPLWIDLDFLNERFDSVSDVPGYVVGTMLASTSGLTVGYVLWTIRGGLLASSILAQMPAWRLVDPLVVLNYLDESPPPEPDDADEESLETIIVSATDQ
ncbi:MAG: tandem-95 repeat protein, partial [Planctomycetes bacterium]|nr:tandem-95 repeat protein [Planctomycetota bacterium]